MAPPQEAPAEVHSETQESRESVTLASVLQVLDGLIAAVPPLMQYRSNLVQYRQDYQEQRSLKDLPEKVRKDYEKAVGEAEKSLGGFVNRVSKEIDRLQRRPRVRKQIVIYRVTHDERIIAESVTRWEYFRIKISSWLHPWRHML